MSFQGPLNPEPWILSHSCMVIPLCRRTESTIQVQKKNDLKTPGLWSFFYSSGIVTFTQFYLILMTIFSVCLGERPHHSDLYELSLQITWEMRDPICEDRDRRAQLCLFSGMIVSIRRWCDNRVVTPLSMNQHELCSDTDTTGKRESKLCHYQVKN